MIPRSPAPIALALVLASGLLPPTAARAADTIEVFDLGLTELEAYLFLEGLGAPADERWLGAELSLGIGLTDSLSAYLGVATGADHHLDAGESELFFALFGTPVDTDHWDLDLLLEVGLGGPGLQSPTFAPGLELNLDAAPEMEAWGLYLRIALPLFGEEDGAGAVGIGAALELRPGAYALVGERHQLLLEWSPSFALTAPQGEPLAAAGALHLGYNFLLDDAVELIFEATVQLPQEEAPMAVGILGGVVVLMPRG